MSDKQKTALISIGLSAVVAVLAVFGYNVMVVQPEVAALNAQIAQLEQPPEEPAGAVGDTNLTNLVLSGDLTVDGTSTLSGGVAWDWPQSVTAPTAVATATPAFYVNNTGAGNVTLSVRDSATPVFEVLNGGAATFAGAVDVAGWPSYGTGDLRPVGNAANGKIYEFGTTAAITNVSITPVAITTVTAFGCQVSDPAVANAWSCGASLSGKTVTLTAYEIDATPVATPAKPVTYWIAGNQ